jgi:hypothetical protein
MRETAQTFFKILPLDQHTELPRVPKTRLSPDRPNEAGGEIGVARICVTRCSQTVRRKNMKTVSKLILISSLLAAPLALLAKTNEQAYLESYKDRSNTPVPVRVVSPRVDSDFAGQTVKLEFTVDAVGNPKDITVLDAVSDELAQELTVAVAGWKFQPLLRDGKAVPSKVVLPMRIVDGLGNASRFALN